MNRKKEEQVIHFMNVWSEIVLSGGWVDQWVEGAILPCEIVFFLACCEQSGIRCIIESGRQDGYSTAILGEYARRHGAAVYSIDFEADRERTRKCRKRLAAYPELNLLKGDAAELLGRVVQREREKKTALLIDGPKDFPALSLMFASAGYPWVSLVALHNLYEGAATRRLFERLADEPVFYEAFSGKKINSFWGELQEKEKNICSKTLAAENRLSRSSLGVMVIAGKNRQGFLHAFRREFRLYQPWIIYWCWRMGLSKPVSLLFALSHLSLRRLGRKVLAMEQKG